MNIDRRSFGTIAGAGVLGLFFPRKSKASPVEGLSNEQMAALIAGHWHNVSLLGSKRFLGLTRRYNYADVLDWDDKPYYDHDHTGPWNITGDVISCSSRPFADTERTRRIRTASGSLVEVRYYDKHRIEYEDRYDISAPELLVVHLIVGYGSKHKPRTFARVQGCWLELTT